MQTAWWFSSRGRRLRWRSLDLAVIGGLEVENPVVQLLVVPGLSTSQTSEGATKQFYSAVLGFDIIWIPRSRGNISSLMSYEWS